MAQCTCGSKRLRSWLLVGSLILAPACVHYAPKPLLPEDTADQYESRTLAGAGLRRFLDTYRPELAKEWPRRTWHADDLTLAAFYYHPSLDVARAEWERAKAGITSAGGRPNPVVGAGLGYNFSAVGVTPWLPFGSLDMTIETAGKRGHRIAEAKHLSESSMFAIAATAWQVRSQLRDSMVDCAAAAGREDLLSRQISLQGAIVVALEHRRDAGAISNAEVMSSRLLVGKLQLELNDVQSRRAEGRAHLAAAIGVPVRALDDIEVSFDLAPPPIEAESLTSEEARRRALLGRSDVLAVLAEYAASQSALQLEIAKQYPDIHLGPGYEFDDGEHKWRLGLTIELPVLNRNRGPIAEAEARRAVAAARFMELQAEVISEIDRALAVYRVAQRTLAGAASVLETQRNRLASVQAQSSIGAADGLDVLGAQIELAMSERIVLESQAKLQQAIGALENAIQRPLDWPDDIINSAPRREGS